MSDRRIDAAKEVVKSRFPELSDVEPTLQEMSPTAAVVTFRKSLPAEDGAMIPFSVRITVDGRGKVIKVSSSR